MRRRLSFAPLCRFAALRFLPAILGSRGRRSILGGGFGIFQLVLAAPRAVLFDETAGFRELGRVAEKAGAIAVDLGELERHRAALGDFLGLVEGSAGWPFIASDKVIERGHDQAVWQVYGSEVSAMMRGNVGCRLLISRVSTVTSSQPSRSTSATYTQS
jgi:hypothetical protein